MGSSAMGRWAMVLIWITASGSTAWGQADKSAKNAKKGKEAAKAEKASGKVVADPETVKILDQLDAQTYTLEAEGVKKASCKGDVEIQVPGQPPLKGEFRYDWDAAANGGKGKFTFSDPALEGQLKSMNMLPDLDNAVRRENWRENFAGCRLTSRKEGGNTVIQVVEGKSKEGITSVTVNEQGLPVQAEMAGGGPGAPAAGMKITNVKFGDKFAMSKATISMNGAPLGELACEYARVMEFNAPAKVTTSVSMLGQNITNVIKLSDWKVEASPGAEKKSDAPPPKGKAAEKAKASK